MLANHFLKARSLLLTGAMLAGAGVALGVPATAAASDGTYYCSGLSTLSGWHDNVVVTGLCLVDGGPAYVRGNLTVDSDAILVSAFATNDVGIWHEENSFLKVWGNVKVQAGGTAILGCLASSFPCIDDNPSSPTLSSKTWIKGNLTSTNPLGVVVHNSWIGGNLKESGGGIGDNCNSAGIFELFGSVFSAYEDNTIKGSVNLDDIQTCWMGFNRNWVGEDVRIVNNQFATLGAMEITSNHIKGDLACRVNDFVWDRSSSGTLRQNWVGGERSGQCVLSSPATPGGSFGPGKF